MAIKVISNYAKRLGLPGYSSHQFSVSVETELSDLEQVDEEVAGDDHDLASRRVLGDVPTQGGSRLVERHVEAPRVRGEGQALEDRGRAKPRNGSNHERDGKKVQSRVIRERLMREAESNVAIRVSDTPGGEAFEVAGREVRATVHASSRGHDVL